MKILYSIIIILLIATNIMADELQIPMSCYPKDLQMDFEDAGLKLDLSANDRTYESWGYVFSKGSSFSIYTYKTITEKEFELVKKIIFGGV